MVISVCRSSLPPPLPWPSRSLMVCTTSTNWASLMFSICSAVKLAIESRVKQTGAAEVFPEVPRTVDMIAPICSW